MAIEKPPTPGIVEPTYARELTQEEQLFAKQRLAALKDGRDLPDAPPGVQLTRRRVPQLSDVFIRELGERMSKVGIPAERAAQALGVPTAVFRDWLNLGRVEIGELYVRLLEVVERADAEFEVRNLALVAKGEKGWQSRAWALERRFSERYALRTKQEISGPNGSPVMLMPGRVALPEEDPEE